MVTGLLARTAPAVSELTASSTGRARPHSRPTGRTGMSPFSLAAEGRRDRPARARQARGCRVHLRSDDSALRGARERPGDLRVCFNRLQETGVLSGCHGSFLRRRRQAACRMLRPQPDGSVVDVTRQLGAAPAERDLPRLSPATSIGRARGHLRCGFGYARRRFLANQPAHLNADGTYTDQSRRCRRRRIFALPPAGDINVDGSLDIFVNNWGGNGIRNHAFLMGRGDGTFAESPACLRRLAGGVDESSHRVCWWISIGMGGPGARDTSQSTARAVRRWPGFSKRPR